MAVGLPRHGEKATVVEAMFDRIAPRYDLMNRLITFRLDQRWRAAAVRLTAPGAEDTVVDLGCGTGDMCRLAAATGARVVGVDFAAGMLAAARRRRLGAALVRADAERLPLASGSVTVVTCAFALRNFVAIDRVLAEAARVLAPGGRMALLEVDAPTGALRRFGHALYFEHIVPLLGALLADRAAYAYLPRSVAYLPPAAELLRLVQGAGFTRVAKRAFGGGVAQVVFGVRSGA